MAKPRAGGWMWGQAGEDPAKVSKRLSQAGGSSARDAWEAQPGKVESAGGPTGGSPGSETLEGRPVRRERNRAGCEQAQAIGQAEELTRPAGRQARPAMVWPTREVSEVRTFQAGPVWPTDAAQPLGLCSEAGDSCPFLLSTLLLRRSERKPRLHSPQASARV